MVVQPVTDPSYVQSAQMYMYLFKTIMQVHMVSGSHQNDVQ